MSIVASRTRQHFEHEGMRHDFHFSYDCVCVCVNLVMTYASPGQVFSPSIPPEIAPAKYSRIGKVYFESHFGTSFSQRDLTPLVVGERSPDGCYPLQRIDVTNGVVTLHDVGQIEPLTFQRLPQLSATVRNMIDFVSTDPHLLGVDWTLSTRGQSVTGRVTTPTNEIVTLKGLWVTYTVRNIDADCSDVATVFIPDMIQTAPGNSKLDDQSHGFEDYLHEVDCEGMNSEDCAALQQCFANYANCMANADTVYQAAVANCDSLRETLSGAGAGAAGGFAIGACIGSVCPGVGTLLGGAIGAVIGGVCYGTFDYYDCLADARSDREVSRDICANNLEACLEQFIIAP